MSLKSLFLSGFKYQLRMRAELMRQYASKLGVPVTFQHVHFILTIFCVLDVLIILGLSAAIGFSNLAAVYRIKLAWPLIVSLLGCWLAINLVKAHSKFRAFLRVTTAGGVAFLVGMHADIVAIIVVASFLACHTNPVLVAPISLFLIGCVLELCRPQGAILAMTGIAAILFLVVVYPFMRGSFFGINNSFGATFAARVSPHLLLFTGLMVLSLGLMALMVFCMNHYRCLVLAKSQWRKVVFAYFVFVSTLFFAALARAQWPNVVHWPLIAILTGMLTVFALRVITVYGLSPESVSYGVFLARLHPQGIRGLLRKHVVTSLFLLLPLIVCVLVFLVFHHDSASHIALTAIVMLGEIVMDTVVVLHYWRVLPLQRLKDLGRESRTGLVAALAVGIISALVFFDTFGGHLLMIAWPSSFVVIGLGGLVMSIGGFAYLGFSSYRAAMDEMSDESWKS